MSFRFRLISHFLISYPLSYATAKKERIAEGIAIGKAEGVTEGVAKGKALAIPGTRFNKVPRKIEKAIRSITDLIVLESLVEHAKASKSLDEFAEVLK